MLILTDMDLYPQDGWTFVFGVTRVVLRTLIQSIARHDSCFPEVSACRLAETQAVKTEQTLIQNPEALNDLEKGSYEDDQQ